MVLLDLAIQTSAQRRMETCAKTKNLAQHSHVLNLSHFNVVPVKINNVQILMIYLRSITITTMVFLILLKYTRMEQLLKDPQERLFQQLEVLAILRSTFKQTSTLLTHGLKLLTPSMVNHMSSISTKMAQSFQRSIIKPFVLLEERFA